MNIGAIFARKHKQQADAMLPRLTAYRKLVVDLASGVEVDEQSVLEICEAIGADEHKLSADVKRATERMEFAKQLEVGRKAQAEMPRLQSVIDQLGASYREFMEKHAPAMDVATAKLRELEPMAGSVAWAEGKLFETCSDELKAKQADLDARRKAVASELRSVQERLQQVEEKSILLQEALNAVAIQAKRRPRHFFEHRQPQTDAADAERVAQILANRDKIESYAEPLRDQVAELRSELEDLAAEQTELNRAKLQVI